MTLEHTPDAFDQADALPFRRMFYKVVIISCNPLTGETKRSVYPASSMAEALAIEVATDPENARERLVQIVPDAMAYLRAHYPEALIRLAQP